MPLPNLHFEDRRPPPDDFRAAVVAGLKRRPPAIPPKFFYDERGSLLFDAITQLPEYYPTRTEVALLREYGEQIADLLGHGTLLVELGSGSDLKIRVLLNAVRPRAYMPLDISREHLLRSATGIAADHPAMEVHAVCADYTQTLALPEAVSTLPRVAFYPGSSIGNFDPDAALHLLQRVGAMVGAGGRLLVGVDLKKNRDVLESAYNDAQGVTAAFNLNLLERFRRELGAYVEHDGFVHRAFYDDALGRVEMHLVAQRDQTIRLGEHRFVFAKGESIHTESSYKFAAAEFCELAALAGFHSERVICDAGGLFSIHCLRVK